MVCNEEKHGKTVTLYKSINFLYLSSIYPYTYIFIYPYTYLYIYPYTYLLSIYICTYISNYLGEEARDQGMVLQALRPQVSLIQISPLSVLQKLTDKCQPPTDKYQPQTDKCQPPTSWKLSFSRIIKLSIKFISILFYKKKRNFII